MVIEKLLAAMDDPRQPVLAIYQGPVAPVIVTVVVVDPERVFAGERKAIRWGPSKSHTTAQFQLVY